jgi:NADH-quinone oxidoreductase subunit M
MLAHIPVLSLITFSPLIGILILLFLKAQRSNWLKCTAIAVTVVPLALSLWLYAQYSPASGGADYQEKLTWVEVPLNSETIQAPGLALQFQYHMGIDGLSLPLVLLTTVVTLMAALASVHIQKRWKSFYIWFLLLETGMLGVFLARDLVLFFLFFELTLVAMFFLIGIWGYFAREKAANRFLIYNGIGSAVMLIAFVILITTAGFTVLQNGSAVTYLYSADYDAILKNLTDPNAYVNLLRCAGPYLLCCWSHSASSFRSFRSTRGCFASIRRLLRPWS